MCAEGRSGVMLPFLPAHYPCGYTNVFRVLMCSKQSAGTKEGSAIHSGVK
jgi:hypothetical protein